MNTMSQCKILTDQTIMLHFLIYIFYLDLRGVGVTQAFLKTHLDQQISTREGINDITVK